uniref:Methyltransferase FkbM domain-containing protein n=1 Tax=viral metagenome TaxID=1070528 RepID=A0A6C0DRJ1_9ZZZZ
MLSEEEPISGEKFQEIADIYIGDEESFSFNPVIHPQKEKQIDIDWLQYNVFDNPKIVFCYSHHIEKLGECINNLMYPFILITHNSDENINYNKSVEKIATCPNLIHWYSQNLIYNNPKITTLPIGIANNQWQHGLDFKLVFSNINKIEKTENVYMNFNINTNLKERTSCYNTLTQKNVSFLEMIDNKENFYRLSRHKFCVCPEGNGVDTHRIWEALYLKCVPIVKRSSFIENLIRDLSVPMVILEDWEDFAFDKLPNYDEFIFDNRVLSMDYYIQKIKGVVYIGYSNKDNVGILLEEKIDILFKYKRDGFFIELGANDGLFQSNTAFLEKERGWKGILNEPSIKGYELCKKNRHNSICLHFACVSNDYIGETIFGDFNENDAMGSINGERTRSNNLCSVQSTTLEKILDIHLTNGKEIDLLSLDVEGYELNVLKGVNLDKYRPTYLLIEIYIHDYDNMVNYLHSKKYCLQCNFTNYNYITNPIWDGTHNDYLFKKIE